MVQSIEDVVRVHHRVGAEGDADAVPDVLIEVPHAADRRAQFDGLAARLSGPFPERLHEFFHLNTDVGAWALAEAMAERWVQRRPSSHVLMVECLVPRTFVDCNRRVDFSSDAEDLGRELARAGLTEAIAPYVTDPADRALLTEMLQGYVRTADAAYALVCTGGGLAINPHTYGPRSVPIERIDENIVSELRRVHEPEVYAASPLRPHVDVIARDREGRSYAPEGMIDAVAAALRPLGLVVEDSVTYQLHPVTQGWRHSTRYAGRMFGFEVRRDLLCAWMPFAEQEIDAPRLEAIAGALVEGIDAAWP